jgi:hypothetical protein
MCITCAWIRGGESLVQANAETLDLVCVRGEVVAREFEECVCNLEHKDVGMIVFMADKDSFASAAHAMSDVVFFEAFETRYDGGVFF